MSRCSKMFQTCHLRRLSWMVHLLQIFLGNIVSQHRWSISSSSWPHPVAVQELISTRAKGTLLGPCWYTRLCLVPHWCHHFSTFTPKHSDDSSSFLPCSAAFAKVKSWKVRKRHEGSGGVPCSPQLVEQWSIKENSATTLNHMFLFSGKRKTNQNHHRKFQQPALNKHISSSSLQLVQQCISQWVEKINASICWTIFVNRSIRVPSSRQPIN